MTSPTQGEAVPSTPAASTPVPTSAKAVTGLIFGFFFFLLPCALVAIVLGHMSRADIRKSAGRLTGDGIAVASLVLGYIGLAIVPIIVYIVMVVLPGLAGTPVAADESAALTALHTINEAAGSYKNTYGNGFPPSLEALSGIANPACDHAALIDNELASGTRNGYTFTYTPQARQGSSSSSATSLAPANGCSAAGADGYAITANPVERGATGQRSFYTDQSGVIRSEPNGPATQASPPVHW